MISRYPGAQPFADNDTSRLVFCGRDADSVALLNLLLAHRLVVVYAKSGLGKTSLLQAGLAQKLRDENCLPLTARLNVVGRTPLVSVLESIELEARRQGVEHRAMQTASLWHYFKTAEFWHGDLLMTPVLVLDQFEEIFTLQEQQARADFLSDLGFLVRGVRPPGADASTGPDELPLSEKPPNVRVVLALREEFLGLLEEAADDIPQILDHRFRLRPLGVEGAAEAIAKPAANTDGRFSTPPFRYAPGTIGAIIDALAVQQTTDPALPRTQGHVEPFHLQLICHRAEEIAAERHEIAASRQRAKATTSDGLKVALEEVTVSFDDLGGVAGIQTTLREFYSDIRRSIHPPGTRRRVERLCADFLINPQGRRLSVERGEIERILKVDADTLKNLVDRRLLRVDQRADGWYYELSHDSLVQPILATRRVRSMTLGGLGLIASVVEGVVALIFLAVGGLGLVEFLAVGGLGLVEPVTIGAALIGVPFVLLALWHASSGGQRSVETLTRYVRLTGLAWAICAYAAFVLIQWAYDLALGDGLQAAASVQILQLAQTAFLGGAAIALVRNAAVAVPLLVANLVTTIAVSILRYPSDIQSSEESSSVFIASAFSVGFGAASLAYAWFLRKKRVLH